MCPWTEKSVHIYLAGNAVLHIVPLFEKQKLCFVVGWGGGQRLQDEHQTVKFGYLCGLGFVERVRSLFTLYASVIKQLVKMRCT